MILLKRFTSKEVLEILTELVAETLPEGSEGNLSLSYDNEGGIVATFIEDGPDLAQA